MTEQKHTESGRPLDAKELGGVAYHLFNEGQAVVDTNPNEAIVWLVQCLHVLKQVPDSEGFDVVALYFVGRALARLGRNAESACALRAAMYIGQHLEGEETLDNLYPTAVLFEIIGEHALARHWLQEICRRYEELGCSEKVTNCRKELARVAGGAGDVDWDPVELSFLLDGRAVDRLRVAPDGVVSWQETPLERPVPVGRNVPWRIACVRL